ncbi:MAG: carboxylesterase/lipase family protein [Bacteroidales bacterium]|nr:carboxylesterase/lipase family protein [Bacteroidales bacterium]
MKIAAFHAALLFAGIMALSSCGNASSPQYGSPVFGTVTDEHPVAVISSGKISGENRDGIAIFRGIPYGGPCDGANRWMPPTPVQPWEGTRDCTVNGPIAMQNSQSISADPTGLGRFFNGGHPELFGCEDEYESENCLVLDVLTPGIDKAARPVLVYIHGGGFATGSGSLVLGADRLSREEDMVIVGVNHRLNIFGYLYLGALDPAYETSGSVGMQDLVQALQWVRNNIAALGGDPSKVTIMGESGGGSKVCNLMAMPSAKGLFRSAIIESGASAVGNLSKEAAAAQTEKLLEKLGIDKKDWKKLLTMDAKAVEDAKDGIQLSPVADGKVIPFVEGGDWAPELSSDIPVLVGASADEMGVFSPLETLVKEITWDNIEERVAANGMSADKAEKLVQVYRANNPKNDAPWHTYIKIVSTSGFLGSGAGQLASARAAKSGFAPVWQYFVEYDSQSVVSPDLRCAWHTADLPLQMRVVLHPESEPLSKMMAHAWAAFVRTGDPSTEELPWPAFTTLNKNVMVFDDTTRIEIDPLAPYRAAW